MAKTLAGGGEKTKTADETSKVITEPNPNDAVSKKPEPQKVLSNSGKEIGGIIYPTLNVGEEKKDEQEVHLNHVGQKIDKPLIEATSYLTLDGKIMSVQMEEEGQVFAGEHGKNAEWFPKSVVDTWQKHEGLKVKEEKTEK